MIYGLLRYFVTFAILPGIRNPVVFHTTSCSYSKILQFVSSAQQKSALLFILLRNIIIKISRGVIIISLLIMIC